MLLRVERVGRVGRRGTSATSPSWRLAEMNECGCGRPPVQWGLGAHPSGKRKRPRAVARRRRVAPSAKEKRAGSPSETPAAAIIARETCALAPQGVTYARVRDPRFVCIPSPLLASKCERCVRNANSRGDGDPTRRRGRSPKGRQLRLCRCATSRAVALGYEEPFPPDPGARCTLTRGQRMKKRIGIVVVNATRRGPGRHIEKDA